MQNLSVIMESDLQDGYQGPNWIDISLKDTLDNTSYTTAFRDPPGNVHSIAGIVCHLIDWRKALIEVLEGVTDWKVNQEASFETNAYGQKDEAGWKNIKAALEETQKRLSYLLLNTNEPVLQQTVPQRTYVHRYFISGIIQHDAYHLGQIVLLAKQFSR